MLIPESEATQQQHQQYQRQQAQLREIKQQMQGNVPVNSPCVVR
ncbi:hypothetical protein [Photorhabdus hainanensis]|nr:hypothetical protein [Photorhabdus hainanensis]